MKTPTWLKKVFGRRGKEKKMKKENKKNEEREDAAFQLIMELERKAGIREFLRRRGYTRRRRYVVQTLGIYPDLRDLM